MSVIVILTYPVITILLIIYMKMKKMDHMIGFTLFWGIVFSVLTLITEYMLSIYFSY